MNSRKKRSPEDLEQELETILREPNVALTDARVIQFLYNTFPTDDDDCF